MVTDATDKASTLSRNHLRANLKTYFNLINLNYNMNMVFLKIALASVIAIIIYFYWKDKYEKEPLKQSETSVS